MDFMGIGALEVILILVLGFLFFGPEKLPGMAARAGKWYRNFTRAANNFTKTLNDEIEEEKKSISADVKSALEPPQESLEPPQKSSGQPDENINNETDKNLNG
jgi:Sec-independent protein translocase protein TatA